MAMLNCGSSRYSARIFVCALIAILSTIRAGAQVENQADTTQNALWVTVSGNVSLTADLYDFTSDPTGKQAGRRPKQLYRLVFSPTITLGGLVTLPFNIMLTLPETNVTTPSLQNPSIGEYLLNPANAFGFSSFAPRIGWAQFYLGSHTPQYSTLSNSDLPLFGAGIDFQPLGMRIAASGGVVQRAIEPDSVRGSPATYRRDLYMGRVGTAENDNLTFGVNVVYARDDGGSLQNNVVALVPERIVNGDFSIVIPPDTLRLRPEEGMMASADVKYILSKSISFKAEGAVSSFTRDQTSEIKSIEGNPLDLVTKTRVSTRVDYAGTASVDIKDSWWGVSLTALFMGAGYVPLAQPYQQSDRLEWRIAPFIKVFDGDLLCNAVVGYRINNLSGTKGETLSQVITNGNIQIQMTQEFSTLIRYSNFGVSNQRDQDTLRIKNVSQSFGFEPLLMVEGDEVSHTVNASVGIDTYDDFNVVSGISSSNNMRSASLNYLASIISVPLSIGVNGNYIENALFTGVFIVRSMGGMVSYRFMNGDIIPSLALTNSSSTFGSNNADQQLFFKASLRWRITKRTSFNASYGSNNYTYGNPSPRGNSFSERLVQLAFSTSF
ncbi:MAG: hypothetical protein HQ472_02130 [Ignavibacteria bacterium]|nr:hypothetical protein [Ignavibacteria bacterium]